MAAKQSADDLPQAVAAIDVEVIAGQPERRLLAKHFRTSLEDILNPGGQLASGKEYQLRVHFGILTSPGLVAPDGKAQRYIVTLQSSYLLVRIADGKQVGQGNIQRVGSYNNRPNAYFSTYVAEQDTLKRLAEALAEEYRMRMASTLTKPDET